MDKKIKKIKRMTAIIMTVHMALAHQIAWALPVGETVVSGTATFSTTPTSMTVNQATDQAIINYNSFSIGAAEAVRFIQPSSTSIALNRVVGIDPSQILGSLTSNGRVFLINPNGILFGAGSHVDTAGLIASTLGISDADFLAGNYNFSGAGGGVQNLGTLNSPGGFVALLGAHIENSGLIQANLGEIALASGNAMTVSLDPAGIVSVAVTASGTTNSSGANDAILNQGALQANQGKVILSVDTLNGLFNNAVNNQGVIEAQQIGLSEGSVRLEAAGGKTVMDGSINVGQLTSSNTTSDTIMSGDINTTGAGVVVTSLGKITHDYQSSVTTHGGSFQGQAGQDYKIKNGSLIDAGAGTIDILAGQNVIIGGTSESSNTYSYDWNYVGGDRGGRFTELGYYYDSNGFVPVAIAAGHNIGKDGSSATSGSGVLTGEVPDGLYIKVYGSSAQEWYTDSSLNIDASNHYDIIGNVYFAEDLPAAISDADYQDVIVRFDTNTTSYTGAPAIRTTGNMFITAQDGYIVENKGDVSANNLVLNAETGITGYGAHGGFVADVNQLAALNQTSGSLNFEDPNHVTISNLSELTGLNAGVNGLNGLSNEAVGVATDVNAGADLIIEAPVHVHGHLTLTAGHNIVQRLDGTIDVHQSVDDPLVPPVNVHSTTHTAGIVSNPDHNITVQWQLPDGDIGNYDFVANAGHDYLQQDAVSVNTHGGDATMTADNNVELTLVNAYIGTANITAQNGSIIDHDKSTAPSDYDVIANTINLNAPNGSIGGATPDEMDLGAPLLNFSYLWNQSPSGTPDVIIDSYTAFLDGSHKWVFETMFTAPANTTDWWFHVETVQPLTNVESAVVDAGPFLFDVSNPGDDNPGDDNPGDDNPSDDNPGDNKNPGNNVSGGSGSSGAGASGGNIPDQFGQIEQFYPAYYEILDSNQFTLFGPIQPVGFYAYHPFDETDYTAIDGIDLDEEAFDFIDQQAKN